jgi:hypothetical protein
MMKNVKNTTFCKAMAICIHLLFCDATELQNCHVSTGIYNNKLLAEGLLLLVLLFLRPGFDPQPTVHLLKVI